MTPADEPIILRRRVSQGAIPNMKICAESIYDPACRPGSRWRRLQKRLAARRMRRAASRDPQEAPRKRAFCKSWWW